MDDQAGSNSDRAVNDETRTFSRRTVLKGGGALAAGAVLGRAGTGWREATGGTRYSARSSAYRAPRVPKRFSGLTVSEPSPPTSFDPAVSTANVGVFQEMFEGLLGLSPDQKTLFPTLATELIKRVDDVTWRATLHDDRTFTNGKPITPDDVKFSFDRIVSGKVSSPYTDYLTFIKSVTVKGQDITIRTIAPIEIFPYRASMVRVVSQKVLAKMGDSKFSTDGGVGSGSMYNTQPLSPSGITLVPYDKYNGVLPVYTNKAAYTYYPSTSSTFADLEAGEVNVVPFLNPDEIATAKANKSLRVGEVPVDTSTLICLMIFNCGKKPFSDIRVRQAVLYAINREEMIKIGDLGSAAIATSPLPASNHYHVTPKTTYPYDPDKAKSLLKAAGYKSGLTFSLYVSNLGATANYAPILQAQMAAVGINAKVQVLSVDAYFSEIFAGKYDTFVFPTQFGAFSPDVDILIRGWWGGYYNKNACFWNTPAARSIPTLLNKALFTTNESAKKRYYGDIQEIISAGAANMPLIFQGGDTAWTANMAGFDPPAAGAQVAVYKVRPA